MRLNLGSGGLPLEGYVNVDMHCEADVKGDIRELTFEGVEEVVMYHLLEHFGLWETRTVLRRVRSWMNPGARITVEVPDMEAIMANPGPSWPSDVYGAQSHDGEFHKSGFTFGMLAQALIEAGFSDVKTRAFLSTNKNRPGMPCIEATGHA